MDIKTTKLKWIKSKNGITMDFELDVAIHPLTMAKLLLITLGPMELLMVTTTNI